MAKRVCCMLLSLLLAVSLWGCALFGGGRQSVQYLDVFDTVSEITAYGVSAEEFAVGEARLHRFLQEYHQLYDIYTPYEGINNLYTLNCAVGQETAVDSRVLDLLEYGIEAYRLTDGRVNILFGSVLSLWHERRTAATENPATASLPDAVALQEAAKHTDLACLRIDRAAGTVQITDPMARLDVGAIAKGYVTERAAAFVREELGWEHVLLSIGGNIRAIGGKAENRPFAIGVKNPDEASATPYLMKLAADDIAVVTSGDYQRYYVVEGQRYAHIIDVNTLYPAAYMRAVTVLCPDSGLADTLSTALFCMPAEEGMALLENYPSAEAVFLLSDGSQRYSAGFEQYVLN